MKLDNGIISVDIAEHGAELKSVQKNGFEYMWCADAKYWGRISPVLFPFVGGLKNKKYTLNGKEYPMTQHGFARDFDFELAHHSQTLASYVLKSNEETFAKYPFDFELVITYTIVNSTVKINWQVKNKNRYLMSFSIGAHPAFNLKPGDNYFKFDSGNNLIYNLIDSDGLYVETSRHILENNGYVKIENSMFDNDALIIENNQAKEVSICDAHKTPYVTVKFSAPLFGLWSPAKKNAPFVCIEPWYGRCDRNDFCGELSEREHTVNINAGETFEAEYEIELL